MSCSVVTVGNSWTEHRCLDSPMLDEYYTCTKPLFCSIAVISSKFHSDLCSLAEKALAHEHMHDAKNM